ncbi:Lysine exporter protein (LYSE/YGGA) [Haladaptatus paucihalophilus DX253]|uniref:Lysine exporter protein (LYSE/YGGA) n=1 Tax=Haladaptatus paucihalophilus DX253 TaxID=797209 RepID=E7QYP3_HALPU|nr:MULTISPECIES: LysE family translocator [Haladaptatus]EFW90309.1 Lysine exporter protein (LYSE/YGGA) [Haladaptatus paucihalophilus DX253]GKZ12172.1 lysine transporter LysE [Haladaptatus sp. T7]SHK00775.1 Threonine/homoserine/homoserine lactone efflux protein [Haladaptatus paucihalophilus DX253]
MIEMLVSGLAGVVLGLSLAAPPGPMNAVIAEESVLRGWRSGFLAGLGAMTADACFFVLALAGVIAVVREAPIVRGLMVGVGGLLMLYFAYGAAQDATSTFTTDEVDEDAKGFRKAFALAITNPYQIIWWLTAGVGLLDPGRFDVLSGLPGSLTVSTGGPIIIVGFFAGIACWITGFPAALSAAGKRVDSFAPAVAYVSAGILALAGVSFVYDSVTTLV